MKRVRDEYSEKVNIELKKIYFGIHSYRLKFILKV